MCADFATGTVGCTDSPKLLTYRTLDGTTISFESYEQYEKYVFSEKLKLRDFISKIASKDVFDDDGIYVGTVTYRTAYCWTTPTPAFRIVADEDQQAYRLYVFRSSGTILAAYITPDESQKTEVVHKLFYANRMYCNNGFYCPICTSLRMQAMTARLITATSFFYETYGYHSGMITLTASHPDSKFKLATFRESFDDAIDYFKSLWCWKEIFFKFVNLKGTFSSKEVTDDNPYSTRTKSGWHYHVHIFFIYGNNISKNNKKFLKVKNTLTKKWKESLNKFGLDCNLSIGLNIIFFKSSDSSLQENLNLARYSTKSGFMDLDFSGLDFSRSALEVTGEKKLGRQGRLSIPQLIRYAYEANKKGDENSDYFIDRLQDLFDGLYGVHKFSGSKDLGRSVTYLKDLEELLFKKPEYNGIIHKYTGKDSVSMPKTYLEHVVLDEAEKKDYSAITYFDAVTKLAYTKYDNGEDFSLQDLNVNYEKIDSKEFYKRTSLVEKEVVLEKKNSLKRALSDYYDFVDVTPKERKILNAKRLEGDQHDYVNEFSTLYMGLKSKSLLPKLELEMELLEFFLSCVYLSDPVAVKSRYPLRFELDKEKLFCLLFNIRFDFETEIIQKQK